MRNPFIFMSFVTLCFLLAGKPEGASVAALMAIVSLFRVRINPSPKRVKTFKDWSSFSVFEFTKPMDYLHKIYPSKTDTEILNLRDAEMQELLAKAVKLQYGEKAKVEEHFTVKTFYAMKGTKELVVEVRPVSKFGSEFVRQWAQGLLDKGMTMYEEDDKD